MTNKIIIEVVDSKSIFKLELEDYERN